MERPKDIPMDLLMALRWAQQTEKGMVSPTEMTMGLKTAYLMDVVTDELWVSQMASQMGELMDALTGELLVFQMEHGKVELTDVPTDELWVS